MKIKIENHDIYLYEDEKKVGYIQCSEIKEGVIDAKHTVVLPEYQGQGLAGKLFEALVDHAKKNQLKIIPTCSYILRKFENDDQYDDIYYQ